MLIRPLVFSVKHKAPTENDVKGRVFTSQCQRGNVAPDSRRSLVPDSWKLGLHNEMSVTPGRTVALCELGKSSLSRWVRLAAVCRPQELWRERGALGDAAVAQLDDVRHWEEADHVHQQLKSESCGEAQRSAHSDTDYSERGPSYCVNSVVEGSQS